MRREQDLQTERALLVEQALLLSRWVWKKQISKQDIDTLLKVDKQQPSKQMTDNQLLQQAKILNAIFGGEVREK